MLRSSVIQFCKVLVALPVRRLVGLLQQLSRWVVSTGRRVREERSPMWAAIRPQSRILEDPPAERAFVFPLQARWLARVLVASRPLGP
jgi:hypothetical protein